MSVIKKIALLIVIALSISFIANYLSSQKEWNYAYVNKNKIVSPSFSKIDWEINPSENKINSPEDRDNTVLVLTREFTLKNLTEVNSILLKYDYRFSTEIYINNKKCLIRNRRLITPERLLKTQNNPTEIDIYGYGDKRVFLTESILKNILQKGKNTIHIVVTNTEEISSFRINKISLTVLNKETAVSPTTFTKSALPIFNIKTKLIPDEPKIKASLNIFESNNTNKLSDSSVFHNIKIEVRGNTSQSFAKQSYSFNVYDSSYNKVSIPLLNLPHSNKWVLQGPYADKSLIRNALTYSLYRQMGNYAPKTQFVDLIINNNYRGIYVLTEKIQIGANHLNIQKLKQDTLENTKQTGGYLLEIDRNEWRSNYPPKNDTSVHSVAYCIFSPKKEKINPVVEQKIKAQFNLFEQHLYENNDPYKYLDINSFIDYLIITELTKNTDGYCLSTFLYNKNINNKVPKFYIGPIWDYNLTFGLADYREGFNPEGFVYNATKYIPFWWKKLLADSTFKMALNKRYSELRTTSLSNNNIYNTIDSLAQICTIPAERNFKKWTILGGAAPWPNYFIGDTYNDEIDYVKNWTEKRLVFLDNQFLNKQ